MLEELCIGQFDAQSPLALPQRVFAETPFDELRRLSRQQIEKSSLTLREPALRLSPFGTQHANGSASAGDQRCRMSRPDTAFCEET